MAERCSTAGSRPPSRPRACSTSPSRRRSKRSASSARTGFRCGREWGEALTSSGARVPAAPASRSSGRATSAMRTRSATRRPVQDERRSGASSWPVSRSPQRSRSAATSAPTCAGSPRSSRRGTSSAWTSTREPSPASARALSGVNAVYASARELPFRDRLFDLVFHRPACSSTSPRRTPRCDGRARTLLATLRALR